MKDEIARHVAMVAFRSSANLTELVPLLKDSCEDTEYKEYLDSVAAVSGEIAIKILGKIYKSHPEIKREIDGRIGRYGFLISG